MPNDQRIAKLPDHDDFWKSVDNGPTREYYNACVIEYIRNFSGQSETDRIEFVAKLKLFVELLDSPVNIWKSIQLQKIEEQERSEAESVL